MVSKTKASKTTLKREDFLRTLESVSYGVTQKDEIEQSSCFIFTDGMVYTFNDRVACRVKSGMNGSVVGAVPAEKLRLVLDGRDDEEVRYRVADGGLHLSGSGWKSFHRMEAEIQLPISSIPVPEEWIDLPEDFCDAVAMVSECTSENPNMPHLMGVHLHPKWIEACDNMHACRWLTKTGLTSSVLIPGKSIKGAASLGVTEIGVTDGWVHFRNAADLVYSCRTIPDEPQKLKGVFVIEGTPIALPKRLSSAAERGNIFAKEGEEISKVLIDLQPGKLKLRGEGLSGWYEESKKINYEGEPLKFYVSPTILKELVEKHNDCIITQDKLAVKSETYTYVTVLMRLDEEESSNEGEPSDE